MPFQIKCQNCGAILYESPKDLPGIEYLIRRNNQKRDARYPPITLFIWNHIGSHCKYCGSKLSHVPKQVKVTPVMPRGGMIKK
jgi:hypothetical protein